MELNILHLYPDSMSLYGEWANLAILCRHLEALDVAVTVEKVTGEDTTDFTRADMIYMGAGTEGAQKAALLGLVPHAGELKAAVARGALRLFTGSAMEPLGASVTDAAGKVWQGLALADFTTVETDKRSPGDVIAASTLWEAPTVGFMTKCSLTHGVTTPLFSSLSLGVGNDQEGGGEGYASGNVLATHITGPVLVKNPDFLDLIIRRLFAAKGWELPEALPVFPHEREAYEVTLRELKNRIGG